MEDSDTSTDTIKPFHDEGQEFVANKHRGQANEFRYDKKGDPSSPINDYQSIDDFPWEIPVGDDPGVFISYASDVAIYDAKNNPDVLPAGLMQGEHPVISAANFRHWVVAQFTAVVPSCRVRLINGGLSDVSFHHITFIQYIRIQANLNINAWATWCQQNHQSAGQLFTVTNAGVGSNESINVPLGPFN